MQPSSKIVINKAANNTSPSISKIALIQQMTTQELVNTIIKKFDLLKKYVIIDASDDLNEKKIGGAVYYMLSLGAELNNKQDPQITQSLKEHLVNFINGALDYKVHITIKAPELIRGVIEDILLTAMGLHSKHPTLYSQILQQYGVLYSQYTKENYFVFYLESCLTTLNLHNNLFQVDDINSNVDNNDQQHAIANNSSKYFIAADHILPPQPSIDHDRMIHYNFNNIEKEDNDEEEDNDDNDDLKNDSELRDNNSNFYKPVNNIRQANPITQTLFKSNNIINTNNNHQNSLISNPQLSSMPPSANITHNNNNLNANNNSNNQLPFYSMLKNRPASLYTSNTSNKKPITKNNRPSGFSLSKITEEDTNQNMNIHNEINDDHLNSQAQQDNILNINNNNQAPNTMLKNRSASLYTSNKKPITKDVHHEDFGSIKINEYGTSQSMSMHDEMHNNFSHYLINKTMSLHNLNDLFSNDDHQADDNNNNNSQKSNNKSKYSSISLNQMEQDILWNSNYLEKMTDHDLLAIYTTTANRLYNDICDMWVGSDDSLAQQLVKKLSYSKTWFHIAHIIQLIFCHRVNACKPLLFSLPDSRFAELSISCILFQIVIQNCYLHNRKWKKHIMSTTNEFHHTITEWDNQLLKHNNSNHNTQEQIEFLFTINTQELEWINITTEICTINNRPIRIYIAFLSNWDSLDEMPNIIRKQTTKNDDINNPTVANIQTNIDQMPNINNQQQQRLNSNSNNTPVSNDNQEYSNNHSHSNSNSDKDDEKSLTDHGNTQQ